MADLIAYQNGNWTGSTTWKVVETGTGAKQTDITNSTSTGTSYSSAYSPTFTVSNGAVIEGLLLHCKRLTTTGTVTVALSDDNGVTATREVTVNASDLPADASWVFFKFGSTLAGDGGTDYRVGIKGSSTSNAQFFRSATSADWARYLRTSSTKTLFAAEPSFICAELTGAGTKNDITVTMDSTGYTQHGEVNIGHGGVLSYGTTASTDYALNLQGNLNVWGGGTLNIGTSATRMPSTSTAVLSFVNSVNVDRGLEVRSGGTCNLYGAIKSGTQALLTADAASGQAVINVTSTTGWAVNDVVALASTTRTVSQSEKRTVLTINSGTQATLSTNLGFTHHGTGLYVGEVVNLTRNVKIRGTSLALCSYVNCADTSSFTASYAEFYWLGSNTPLKDGIYSSTTSAGLFSVSFCSLYDFGASNTSIRLNSNSASHTVEDCVWFFSSGTSPYRQDATSGTPSFQRNWIVATTGSITFNDLGSTIRDNRFAGCTLTFNESATTLGLIDNNIQHSATNGVSFTSDCIGEVSGFTVWRNGAYGINIGAAGLTVKNSSFYHNVDNISLNGTQPDGQLTFIGCAFDGGSGAGLTQTSNHLNVSGKDIVFESCTFGTLQTASTFISLRRVHPYQILFRKCTISDTVTITNQSNLRSSQEFASAIKFDKFNNTPGSHRTYKQYGRTQSDQTTFKTAAPSEALIPNTAGQKLPSGPKKFAVASGTTATVTVYVNKSATYNGNQPRLVVKANSIAGIATDTVLATASGGTDSWLTLSGTTPTVSDNCILECYVDCDGTAGTVYVDDWSVT